MLCSNVQCCHLRCMLQRLCNVAALPDTLLLACLLAHTYKVACGLQKVHPLMPCIPSSNLSVARLAAGSAAGRRKGGRFENAGAPDHSC